MAFLDENGLAHLIPKLKDVGGVYITGNGSIGSDVLTGPLNIKVCERKWNRAEMPKSTSWVSIAYGRNGIYVALSGGILSYEEDNIAAYSGDGIHWSSSILPVKGNWRHVCYGANKFVAVSPSLSSGAYSNDGRSWASITLPKSGSWNGLSYGNDVFVSVDGGSNTAIYSSNGINWSSATLPFNNYWFGITYGNNIFVTYREYSNKIAYSSNGINWSSSIISQLPDSSYDSLCYGNGKFILVPNKAEQCVYSENAVEWNSVSLPFFDGYRRLYFCNDKFVLLSGKRCAYSYDGLEWVVLKELLDNPYASIAAGDNKIIGVINDSNEVRYISDIGYYLSVNGHKLI